MSNVATAVVNTIQTAGFPLLPIEIAERGGLNRNTVRRVVRELVASGQLREQGIVAGRPTYAINQ
jgi:DNA-binding IclR family transcriptional regulator